jgi:hypothetical protein
MSRSFSGLIVIRFLVLLLLLCPWPYYLRSGSKTDLMAITITATWTIGGILAFWSSFLRSSRGLLILISYWVAFPLVFWLGLDTFILKGSWWEWIITLPVQMAVPILVVLYLLKSRASRLFFSNSSE